ncbi:MAG: hypothetical protein KGZ25_13850, partial [Planctomycetes bacterium]|nr:hypothetical protein [Planctomycetota bacterium]
HTPQRGSGGKMGRHSDEQGNGQRAAQNAEPLAQSDHHRKHKPRQYPWTRVETVYRRVSLGECFANHVELRVEREE